METTLHFAFLYTQIVLLKSKLSFDAAKIVLDHCKSNSMPSFVKQSPISIQIYCRS